MSNNEAHAVENSQSKILKRVHVDPRDQKADPQELAAIVADLRRVGGAYTPAANWVTLDPNRRAYEVDDGRPFLSQGFSEEAIAKSMSTMEKMLAPWIGEQRNPISAEVVMRYASYILANDPLDLWVPNVADAGALAANSVADLGSIIDLNIIYSYSDSIASGKTTFVLEVGGGYGRLAEATFNVLGGAIKYVLVDSVPASLLYARDYLRQACPGARIGYYYDNDPFDLDAFDCYVVPSWHFETLNRATYDLCINIESFQEMGQVQVDTYLNWFERFGREGALIYLSNARDYKFRGQWNFPATWQQLLCTRIPRAWTQDHRTEVFVKSNRDYSAANAAVFAAYQSSMMQAENFSVLSDLRALTRLLYRSPIGVVKAGVRRASSANEAKAERRRFESVFERAKAGDGHAMEDLRAYWGRRRAAIQAGLVKDLSVARS